MWNIERIEINNIVSFRDAALEITPNVATLIFGRNEDNASQPCNGSGKSSLVEAISFALTGEQLRKVKSVEEIINDNCDTASVFIRLFNDFLQCTFEIRRTISRNSPQVIECHKFNYNGEEIDREITVQPSVADYNKYILSEIGLTKDQIYNYFILCDNKYESFFDTSDKGKKEIINNFSNGMLVDESIARLQSDMEPVSAELRRLEDQVNSVKGSIRATEEAILDADEKQLEAKEKRERQIADCEQKIVECREAIERSKTQIAKAGERKADLEGMLSKVKAMAESDDSLTDCYNQLAKSFTELNVQGLGNYLTESTELKGALCDSKEELEYYTNQIYDAKAAVVDLKKEVEGRNIAAKEAEAQYQKWYKGGEGEKLEQSKARVRDLKESLDSLERQLTSMEVENDRLKGVLAVAQKMIAGAVTCPNCGHSFILADNSSVKDYEKKVEEYERDIERNKQEYNRVADSYDDTQDRLAEAILSGKKLEQEVEARKLEADQSHRKALESEGELNKAQRELLNLETKYNQIKASIEKATGRIEALRNKMLDQAEQLLEAKVEAGKQYISQAEAAISFNEGRIEFYRNTIEDCREHPTSDLAATLKANLENYQKQLKDLTNGLSAKEAELNLLKTQELNFTMFKSYLARKKIDALSLIVNDFLEKIGSDIRLRLEGFSVTKTGKLRDKISVNVMRDGVDCGSYQKFSGGEKARLNLACILSLHTLTNSNCENERGLDFLIIDELLDKSDEVGMATYCEALNKLGQTALLITQGAVAEGYPHKLLITKSKGTSTISN